MKKERVFQKPAPIKIKTDDLAEHIVQRRLDMSDCTCPCDKREEHKKRGHKHRQRERTAKPPSPLCSFRSCSCGVASPFWERLVHVSSSSVRSSERCRRLTCQQTVHNTKRKEEVPNRTRKKKCLPTVGRRRGGHLLVAQSLPSDQPLGLIHGLQVVDDCLIAIRREHVRRCLRFAQHLRVGHRFVRGCNGAASTVAERDIMNIPQPTSSPSQYGN